MPDVSTVSAPPPGWTAAEGGLFVPAVPATAAPVLPFAADAAIRWRLRAARIDNLVVSAGYLVVCLAERWNPAMPAHLAVLLVLGVAYHLAFEARTGQTPGKRRAGIKVVALDGGPAGVRAIAIRSVLRAVDGLPLLYASGLVSMLCTGPARRQRIGDVAAGTTVIAVDGGAVARGTPGRYLPLATLVAVLASAFTAVAAVHAHAAATQSVERPAPAPATNIN